MKRLNIVAAGLLFAVIQAPASATTHDALFGGTVSDSSGFMQVADNDNGQDRRDERGRSDERQDKRDCRQEEGAVGKDKRDCKQEEVRDGVKGNQG